MPTSLSWRRKQQILMLDSDSFSWRFSQSLHVCRCDLLAHQVVAAESGFYTTDGNPFSEIFCTLSQKHPK